MNNYHFDVLSFLDEYEIPYWNQGKNVTKGWVNINCPFCSDKSNHCGINLLSGNFNCWICGEKGTPVRLVSQILEISILKSRRIVSQFSNTYTQMPLESMEYLENRWEENKFTQLPSHCSKEYFNQKHFQYLISRGFDPPEIIEKYRLLATGNCSDFGWKNRIIIPVYENEKILTYAGRDITEKHHLRYNYCSTGKSVISIKDTVYGIEFCYLEKVIIVEGAFDLWKMGDNTLATWGTKFKKTQINSILNRKFERIYILYDGDTEAINQAYKLAYQLSPFVSKVKVIELPKGIDPGSLSLLEAKKLKTKILEEKV